jgi:hypothetical protein
LIWFGHLARFSQRGGREYFICSKDFYLPLQRALLKAVRESNIKRENLSPFFKARSKNMATLLLHLAPLLPVI